MKTLYKVTTSHPTGYMNGTHEVTVTRNPVVYGSGGVKACPETRYCDAAGLGCSRDYTTDSDEEAIRLFLSEHRMTPTSIVNPNAPKPAPAAQAAPRKETAVSVARQCIALDNYMDTATRETAKDVYALEYYSVTALFCGLATPKAKFLNRLIAYRNWLQSMVKITLGETAYDVLVKDGKI